MCDSMKPDSPTAAKAREQRISEIAEREKKATKGPWFWRESEDFNREPQVWAEHYHPLLPSVAANSPFGWSICKTRPKSLTKHSVLWPFPFGEHGWEDGQFIAHARADIPFLLAELATAEKRAQEECAKALCVGCGEDSDEFEPAAIRNGKLMHRSKQFGAYIYCGAALIRSLEIKGE